MRVAVVHYHLRPGGVTRVIENAVRALEPRGAVVAILAGEAPRSFPAGTAPVRVVQGLGYGSHLRDSADGFTRRMEEAARNALGGPPDLWHFHNHALGKNVMVPLAAAQLARSGRRVLFQFHDFAEDGRPQNYRFLVKHLAGGDASALGEAVYPVAPHVHYAAINRRDLTFLARAGVPEKQLHYLPNAVALEEEETEAPPASGESLFLYPTRAIRRKNLGEFLLWSAIAQENERFGVTRAPLNPVAQPIYRRWVAVAKSLRLPVEFDLSARAGLPIKALMRRAHALVTTSVAEGFGLAFLEPWLVERPVVGRSLPEITDGFDAAGVMLDGLYDRLDIPLEWIGLEAVRERLRLALNRALTAYGRRMTTDDLDRALASIVTGDRVDFGRLDEPLQEKILRRVARDAASRARLVPSSLAASLPPKDVIRHNAEAVRREFSLTGYGVALMDIYRSILAAKPSEPSALSARTLLELYTDPARFSMLRT